MTIEWPGNKVAMGLALLATSSSCVPASAGRLTEAVKDQARPKAVVNAAVPSARDVFWRRASKLLVPVSTTPARPFEGRMLSADDRDRSLECLTAAVYHEARSESADGQRAVAQVVLNRVRHPSFPATICGVVFQGAQRRTGCQFSFTCDGSLARGREPAAWERAGEIAAAALDGGVFAPVGNATHYHTTAIRPYWAPFLRKSALVGAHIFYRWAGSAGEANAFRQRHGGLEPVQAGLNASGDAEPVAVHVGRPQRWIEEVRLEGQAETVRIHRGGPRQSDARQDHDVRIHVGTVPAVS